MKLVGIPGSLRKESLNKKLLCAAAKIAQELNSSIEYTTVDLKSLALPVYDQDIEDHGMPKAVVEFKTIIESADIILICTPEYNHSIPGGLKNAIDWASRGKNSFGRKVITIIGATDGMGGTIRAQEHLRVVLAAVNSYVIPYPEVLIRNTDEKIDGQGNFSDEKGLFQIRKLLERTLKIADRINQ